MKKPYPIARLTIKPFILSYIKKIEGIENIPKEPFIVACNHSSFFDDLAVPLIIIFHTNKKLHIFVNDSYFRNYFLRKFLYWGSCIPVAVENREDSKKINEEAFKKAETYLKQGDNIGIFPEGHRSTDGKLLKAKTGIARLALLAKIPVLPMGIIDSWKILPKGKFFPRFRRCTVKIGNPLCFKGKIDKEALDKITTKIMKSIADLTNQEYDF